MSRKFQKCYWKITDNIITDFPRLAWLYTSYSKLGKSASYSFNQPLVNFHTNKTDYGFSHKKIDVKHINRFFINEILLFYQSKNYEQSVAAGSKTIIAFALFNNITIIFHENFLNDFSNDMAVNFENCA